MENKNIEKNKQESKKETLTEIDPRVFEQKAGYDQHTNPYKYLDIKIEQSETK
jgi:hypothetical protein